MQTTYLQALIANNAKNITRVESIIFELKEDARQYAEDGEKAFSIDAYRMARNQSSKLKKLVAKQRSYKAERKCIVNEARCLSIQRKMVKSGMQIKMPSGLTSHEKLDFLQEAVKPKEIA